MSLFVITGTCTVGIVLYFLLSQPKRLHVKVDSMKMKVMGVNIMPIMVMIMNWMPEGMRRDPVPKQV